MGRMVLHIAEQNRLPLVTVETILRTYIELLAEKLEVERSVVIPGITSIRVIYDTVDKEYFVRGRVSPALRKRLNQLDDTEEASVTLSTNLVLDIAERLSVAVSLIDLVLRSFTDGLLRTAETSGVIDIPSVTIIKVTKDDNDEYITRGGVSPAIQSKLRRLDEAI